MNGVPTTTFNEFLSAHDRSAGPLMLEVFRNGEKLEFEMALPVRRSREEQDPTPTMRARVARRLSDESAANLKLS